jgi:hypothetical protein
LAIFCPIHISTILNKKISLGIRDLIGYKKIVVLVIAVGKRDKSQIYKKVAQRKG